MLDGFQHSLILSHTKLWIVCGQCNFNKHTTSSTRPSSSLSFSGLWQGAVHASAAVFWYDGHHQNPETGISNPPHVQGVPASLQGAPADYCLWPQNCEPSLFRMMRRRRIVSADSYHCFLYYICVDGVVPIFSFLTQESAADCCDAICKAVITRQDGWKVGRTKIFLKVELWWSPESPKCKINK